RRVLFRSRGQRAQLGAGPVPQPVPGRLLPARGDEHRRHRGGLAVPARPGGRTGQQPAAPGRNRRPELAGEPEHRAAVDHRAGGVAQLRLPHGGLPGRPAGDPGSPVRGGPAGRRRPVGAVPLRHPPDVAADAAVRGGGHRHRLPSALRGAVRHDAGRTALLDAVGLVPHLQPVRVRQLRIRRGRQLGAVRRHRRSVRVAVPAVESEGLMEGAVTLRRRDRVARTVLYAVLLAGLAVVVAPFVWMVLSSFKPEGEIRRVPPTWWPETFTLDNYVRLFSHLDFPRYFVNSVLVAGLITVGNLVFCSAVGYALAKLR